MSKTLRDLSILASQMLDMKDVMNIDKNKMELLFPFIETLGYDITAPSEVVTSPVYNIDGTKSFDYGLVEDIDSEKFKVVIKVVPFKDDFSKQIDLIKEAYAINNNVRYAIITDCYNFAVYENIANDFQSTINKTYEFSLINISESDIEFFNVLGKNNQLNINNQVFAEDRYPVQEFINEDPNKLDKKEDKSENSSQKYNIKNILSFIKDPKIQKIALRTALMITGAIVILMVVNFILIPHAETSNLGEDPNINNTQQNNPWDIFGVGQNPNTTGNTGIQYIDVKNILDLHVYQPQNELEIRLISDLIEGSIIKYEIYCGSFKKVIYSTIKSNGESLEKFKIPENWENPQITVASYMRFDEEDYPQPKQTKKAYGDNGQYIIQKKGNPQFGLTYQNIQHENAAVAEYVKRQVADKERQLAITRERDFMKLETRVDAFGNIKHLPKGFDMDSANIKENRNIYPQIFYSAEEKVANFYIVAGFNNRRWVMFESVLFYADGHEWGYPVSSNQKKSAVSGSYLSEWIYFNNVDTSTLLNDMILLANSKVSKISFSGVSKKEHILTDEEKQNLKHMLYVFHTYYNDGKIVPNPEWFKETYTEVNLDYIVKPIDMREKDSANYKEMITLSTKLADKRANGEKITTEEINLLESMNSLFKPISKELQNKLYDSIKSTTGLAIFDDDFENGTNSFFKIYFDYDKQGTPENGYIPYINIYSNGKVHIPLKSDMISSSKYEKTLVEFELDRNLYKELSDYLVSQVYKQY